MYLIPEGKKKNQAKLEIFWKNKIWYFCSQSTSELMQAYFLRKRTKKRIGFNPVHMI